MVIINDLFWVSKDAMEAQVTITDGVYSLVCFCQPCNLKISQKILEPVYCMDNTNVVRSRNEEYHIKKLNEVFGYNLTGKLFSKKCRLVKVGQIILQLEKNSLPGDIEENEYLDFNCKRLDIY